MVDRRNWTAEEIERAIALRAQGYTAPQVAQAFGRVVGSVHSAISRYQRGIWAERKGAKAAPRAEDPIDRVKKPRANAAAARNATIARRHAEKAAQPKRKCLQCTAMFLSWGVGNRICEDCKGLASWQSAA